MQPDAMNSNLRRRGLLDSDTHLSHGCQRSQTIVACQESADFTTTFGYAAQHQRTMGDGLVTRNGTGSFANDRGLYEEIQWLADHWVR